MESFDIELSGTKLTVEPLKGGSYRIMEESRKLCVVYAVENKGEVLWFTEGDLNKDFVQQIGELITEYNMSKNWPFYRLRTRDKAHKCRVSTNVHYRIKNSKIGLPFFALCSY